MKSASIMDTSSKITSAILITILILSSILSFTLVSAAVPPTIDSHHQTYQKDYGELHNDTYVLYPWDESSIDIGFSKYGEMINDGSEDGSDKSLGLRYKGIDVFASDELQNVEWSNGWLMDIHYVEDGRLKNVWAYALYSDLEGWGGSWKQEQTYRNGTAPGDDYGGRRTNGWCVTDPIRVIYDGPRKAIYLLRTIIHDRDPDQQGTPMIQLDIQLIFNKVKKYVIEIKDIKQLEKSKWVGPFQIEFSQRGEWDIGTDSVCESYAEFYDDLITKYWKHPFYAPFEGAETDLAVEATNDIYNIPSGYDLCQMISAEPGVDLVGFAAFWPSLISKWVAKTGGLQRDMVLSSLETFMDRYTIPTSYTEVWYYPQIEDEQPLTNLTLKNPTMYEKVLKITLTWPAIKYPHGQGIWKNDPWVFKGPTKTEMEQNVEWYWKSAQTVYIRQGFWTTGQKIWILYKRERKGAKEQSSTPELCCEQMFGQKTPTAVTTYGMTAEPNVPYVFAEWDFILSPAAPELSTHHFRCVSVYGVTDDNNAKDPNQPTTGTFMIDSEVQYQLNEIFNPWDLYNASHKDTFRWAQKGFYRTMDHGVAGSAISSISLQAHLHDKYCNDRTCLLDEHDVWFPTKWGYYCNNSEKVILYDINGTKAPKLLIPKRAAWVTSGYTVSGSTISGLPSEGDYEYYKVLYSTKQDDTIPGEDEYAPGWDTGRWEWITVGRDSRAVDSAGAAMVSIAWEEWKGKQVWLSGLDMQDDEHGPRVPWVLRDFSHQYTSAYGDWRDYTYNEPRDVWYHDDTKYRFALKDDWCQPPFDEVVDFYDEYGKYATGSGYNIYPYAISSANIIVVGGPYANKVAWYFNDFTDAFVFSEYEDGFYAPGCWARTSQPTVASVTKWGAAGDKWTADELWYNSTTLEDDVGHAIVSTYKDLNETIGFIVYGLQGEDTYYACYALRGGLLNWMQYLQEGVTTLVLEFDYDYTNPQWSTYSGIHPIGIHVAEAVGTITECTGFDTNFKTSAYDANKAAAKASVESLAASYGICYKLVDITWCAQVHPDP